MAPTGQASEKAMEAAQRAVDYPEPHPPEFLAVAAVRAAHDPSLGPYRSVCLKDVAEGEGLDVIMQAVLDPGQFTERRSTRFSGLYEPFDNWQRRAITIALYQEFGGTDG